MGNTIAIEGIVCHSIYSNSKPLILNRKFLKHFRKLEKENVYKDLRSIDTWLNSQYQKLEKENELYNRLQ